MSARTSSWAWSKRLSATRKLVLLLLSEKASDNSEAIYPQVWINPESDAPVVCLSVESFRKCIMFLIENRYIRLSKGNLFDILIPIGGAK